MENAYNYSQKRSKWVTAFYIFSALVVLTGVILTVLYGTGVLKAAPAVPTPSQLTVGAVKSVTATTSPTPVYISTSISPHESTATTATMPLTTTAVPTTTTMPVTTTAVPTTTSAPVAYPLYLGCWNSEDAFGTSRVVIGGPDGAYYQNTLAHALATNSKYMAMCRVGGDGWYALFNTPPNPAGMNTTDPACSSNCIDNATKICGSGKGFNGALTSRLWAVYQLY
jgi:hypothetical protein